MGEKKKEKEKEKKDKEKKKEKEKATVRSAPDGSDNNDIMKSFHLCDFVAVIPVSDHHLAFVFHL